LPLNRPTAVPRSIGSGQLLFGAACVLFALSAWRVLTAERDWLLEVVPDDSFYYLQIARNLANSGRSTFDGLSSTNGYHPLWMALLSGVAALTDDRETLLRAAIGVSFGFHVGVALGMFYSVRRLVDSAWGWAAASCWLINPLAFSIAIQGTEASLYALAAIMVFLTHLQLISQRAEGRLPSFRLVVRYGAALGFLCLARTDGIVIAALGLLWLTGSAFSKRHQARPMGLRVLAAGAMLALVVTPWCVFSIAQVGTIVQDSGAMKMLWASDLYPTAFDRLENIAKTFEYFGKRCLTLMTLWNFSWTTFAACGAVLSAAPLVVLIRHANTLQARALRAAIAPTLALALVYGCAFVERQIWWLVLPCLSLLLVMFISFPLFLRSKPLGTALEGAARLAVVVLAVLLIARWHIKGHAPYPWQPDVRRSQLAIEALVPASERVGCFNAGIPAFFGSGRVVALDGLVNHEARESWRERRFDAYLVQHHIHFIADEQGALNKALRFTRAPLRLEELASYPLRGSPTGKRLLWRVSAPSGNE
jgi:hypothetical protein